MNEVLEVTCIVCPLGCPIEVELREGVVSETRGYECTRGKEYALDEVLSPVRTVTTTVRVNGGILPLVPVRTDGPIPKGEIHRVLEELAKLRIDAPVAYHQVILDNLLENDVRVIASRRLPADVHWKKAQDTSA
jgi:CxxC motif-containing protein